MARAKPVSSAEVDAAMRQPQVVAMIAELTEPQLQELAEILLDLLKEEARLDRARMWRPHRL